MRKPLSFAVLLAALAACEGHERSARLDAGRLRAGRFEYRITLDGEKTADLVLTIHRREDGVYRFTGEVVGENSQLWESAATSSFEPISAALQFRRDGRTTSSMRLEYADGRATSVTRSDTDPETGGPKADGHPVSVSVPEDLVDQRIDWAAVLASELEVGEDVQITVYDPGTGASQLRGRVAGEERIHVPAGACDTYHLVYRIEKATGTEPYEMWASKEPPREVVRMRFPGGAILELVGRGAR